MLKKLLALAFFFPLSALAQAPPPLDPRLEPSARAALMAELKFREAQATAASGDLANLQINTDLQHALDKAEIERWKEYSKPLYETPAVEPHPTHLTDH